MGASSSRAVINAPIDRVWQVLYDVESIVCWQPDMQSAKCLKRDRRGRPVLVHMVLDTVIRQTEATLSVSYAESGVMRWEKESGNVPGFVGSWTLTSVADDRTSAEYSLAIDFGRFGKLMRGPIAGAVNGATGSSMPSKLKAYVERLAPEDQGLDDAEQPARRRGAA